MNEVHTFPYKITVRTRPAKFSVSGSPVHDVMDERCRMGILRCVSYDVRARGLVPHAVHTALPSRDVVRHAHAARRCRHDRVRNRFGAMPQTVMEKRGHRCF